MPLLRNRRELAGAVCFIAFAIVSFTVSPLFGLPIFVLALGLSLRARPAGD
jgi:hypothetical protein